MDSPTLKRLGKGPHAAYVQTLLDGVEANARDGGRLAQVAAIAVRGIVSVSSVEWSVLVETYGIPTTRDWQMAQRAYGPARNLPGVDEEQTR